MAKITRKSQKIFGGDLTASGNIGVFGSLKAGSPAYSTDPETIQSSHYPLGWADAVVANNAPALQDMNGLFYNDSYQLAYLSQTGVPEWDDATTYYIGSVVNDGTGRLYTSLTDNNLNNALSSSANWKSIENSSPVDAKNYTLASSVGGSALTIFLKNESASDPSSGKPCIFAMRDSTAATGTYSLISATTATSIVIPSGATLGMLSGVDTYIYVYALSNAGVINLGVSLKKFDDTSLVSTTAISGSSTSSETMYSASALTSRPCRLIGRVKVNETTAGTYSSNATEISIETTFLTGGMVGRVNGLNLPAGYVGEKITGTTTNSTQVFNSTSFVDQTSFSLSLTPGIYDIHLLTSDVASTTSVAGASGNICTVTVITDSSNNVIAEDIGCLEFTQGFTATASYRTKVSAFAVNITANTTYKVRRKLSGTGNGHTCTANGFTDGVMTPQFFAIRRA